MKYMKSLFNTILVLAFCVLSCVSLYAQDKNVILYENFENGIPTTWTQDQLIGDYLWTIESGDLSYPEGTTSGTKRVAFRNGGNQTTANVTRLVLPELNLAKLFQPILCFSYAQDKWAGDCDTLRVLYRRSPNNKWVVLKTYDKYVSDWQRDTIRLVAVTSTYQIAFEGVDNLGRGIVLDDIEVRSVPNCTQPFNLTVSQLMGKSVTLEWAGSFDALKYHVKIANRPLTPEELYYDNSKFAALDPYFAYYEVAGENYSLDVNNLTPATKYYFYVQSECVGENSEWSDYGYFTTSEVVDVPFYESFDLPYIENTVSYMPKWYVASSNLVVSPFVNTDQLKSKRLKYSPDSTTALMFFGKNNDVDFINKGAYTYAVAPELNVDDVSKLQVSFWTINQMSKQVLTFGSDFCKIVVGVMTDPSNKNTFVPVDTVEITSVQKFEEVFVSLETYKGNGKFIAFMSEIKEGTNAFVIDDLTIEYIPVIPKAQISVGLPSAEALEVNFVEQTSNYEVIVSNAHLDTKKIDNKKVVARASFTSQPCRIEGLHPWAIYYVYGRNLTATDTGAWSNAVNVLMPEKLDTVPTTISFDINTFDDGTYYSPGNSTYKMCNGLLSLSNGTTFPTSTQQYWTEPPKARTPWELSMESSKAGMYQLAVFPELINPEKTKVSFYVTRHLIETAAFAIGVVSDANNVESFQPIDTIILTPQTTLNEYVNYKYDLGDYDINGRFFAIKTMYDYCGSWSKVWIDDVRFFENEGCDEPANIVAQTSEDKVTISWDDNGASSWNVLVTTKEYLADEVGSLKPENYFAKKNTNKPTITINGLETGEITYYYYIQSECSGVLGIWSLPQSFKTECALQERLPYSMNFDKDAWIASSIYKGFPVPCLFTVQSTRQGDEPGDLFYYPYLSTAQATTGTKSLMMAGSVKDNYSSYIAFPKMNATLTSLQISFDMIADSAAQVVEVGVMSDPLKIETFEVVTTVAPSAAWKKYVVKFDEYTGTGQYIAIRTSADVNNNYIDNVVISWATSGGGEGFEPDDSACQSPSGLTASGVTKTEATIAWNTSAPLVNLVVANKELTVNECDEATVGGNILVVEQLSAKNYKLTNLRSSSSYHFYVQAICSDTASSHWAVGHFNTNCDVLDTYEMGVESFDYYGVGEGSKPNCYIVGNLVDSATSAYIPYCSDEYSHSGSASLKLASTPSYNGAYAITPEIDIDSISRLRVRFNASVGNYYTSQYASELIVAVLTDPKDLSSQTDIDTIKIYGGEDLQYEVRFDEYIGDYDDVYGRYVMFVSYSSKNNVVFIDDVVFDTIPTCVAPKVKELTNTPNRLVLNLYGGGLSYQAKYIIGNYSQEAIDVAPIHDIANGNLEINGLSQNTACYVMVRSVCGSDYSDWSPVLRFTTTQLAEATLPYYDPFTQNAFAGEYNNPLDWTTQYTSDDAEEQYRYPYVSTDQGDNKVVYLYSDAASKVNYMATPKFSGVNLSQCQVSFRYKPDVSSVKAQRAIVVGVVSDASSKAKVANTFQPIDTIITTGALEYNHVVVPLSAYSGSAKHVAFMVTHSLNRAKVTDKNGTYGGCYIDDVVVELIPTCQRPTNFRLTALGDTYANFKFSHAGATKYEVKYGLSGFDVASDGTLSSITDTTFSITGLTPKTKYDFYVRAYCSATEVSAWSLCESYTTFEVPVSKFPYDNKFEDATENSQFSILNSQSNMWYVADSLYISGDNGATATYKNKPTNTWAYRTFDLKEGVYTISFDWKSLGDGADYMRVLFVPALSQFTDGSADVFNFDGSVIALSAAQQSFPSDWIDLGLDGKPFNLSSNWATYSKTFLVTPEMAGFYRLVFYWANDDISTSATNASAVVDNLFVEKATCSYPYNFIIEDINSTYLTLSWTPVDGTPKSYNVVALTREANPSMADPQTVAYSATVALPQATISDLVSGTDYYIYVQANCDGNQDLSHWSEVYKFTTPCDPKPLGTIFSFELDEGYYLPTYDDGEINTSYRIPDCFVSGHSNAEETPYIKDNTVAYPHSYRSGIYQVARTGEYALKLYSNSEEKIGGYMALPLIDGNFDELQVSFWIRPFGAVKGTDNVNSVGLNAVFARKITVGTMTNPDDPSTFEPLKVVAYPFSTEDAEMASGSFVFEDVEGTNYWRKHSVLLKGAKGKFIAFKNEMYDGKENNQMYIDDIVVDYIDDCMTPSSPMVEAATATTALLNASTYGGSMFEVQISTEDDMSVIWRTDTVSGFPTTLTNLNPGQDYYMRIRTICGETQQSDWSSITNCITAYSTRYSTDELGTFEINSYTPRHWQRSCGTSAADIFSQAGSAMVTDPSSPMGWTVKDGHLATYVLGASTKTANPYCWIFSSSIELPKGKVVMLFDLALTDDDGEHPADSTVDNSKDKFYVVVSDDNGRSWVETQKFSWTNDGHGDYDYNAIPFEGATYSLDLSPYAGKVIRLAFYSECQSSISSELHISNIHINSYIDKVNKSVICETSDYRFQDFFRNSTEMIVGDNNFVYHKRSELNNVADTIYNLEIDVTPLPTTLLSDAICVGDVYGKHNFDNLTRPGIYKQKIASASGCDSVVVLDLIVNSIDNIVLTDTICFGSSFDFNGKLYDRTGVYTDTLVSSITGCDSIVSLLLSVTNPAAVYDTVNICSGRSYNFGSITITESGVYTETFKSIHGCDSIVTLTANVSDNLRQILNEFICPGEKYTGHGFKGVPNAGSYTLPLTSIGGCDSTIVLNLMVLDKDTIKVNQKITTADLPYKFVDKVYDRSTQIGTYNDEFVVTRDNCSSVVKLTLVVEQAVSIDNVHVADLTLYPNPVIAGEAINILADLPADELNDIRIEVYNMLGACIYSVQQSSLETQLSIDDRGLYIVRLVTTKGNIHTGKIIVK